jgi:anti-sigma-K factor RskA
VAAVLDDETATTIEMPGQLSGLAIVYSAEQQAAVLTGADVAVPEGDRVYELWAIRGSNAPERVDIFRPDTDGGVELYLPGIDPASAVWAVTEEPAGGSDTPTLPILNSTA